MAAIAFAAVVAGCGVSHKLGAPVATTHVTMVKSYRFDPDVIRVKAGDTVTWRNDDNFTHTVHVDGYPDHKVDRGDTFSLRFDKPGTYDYVCTLHSRDMRGRVVVE